MSGRDSFTPLRVLHSIHDFLPRHPAGSEIYTFNLCREQAARHHVTIVCAEFDPGRRHGQVTWRTHAGLPVVEIVNNWVFASFAETYRSPLIGDRLTHVLRAVQPDVVHIHNLLNLSFDLPALARARGIPVVATLHDYTLVCPSGGQRTHAAERHVCHTIDADRCARCFRQSPFHARMSFGRLVTASGMPGPLARVAAAMSRRFPVGVRRLARTAARIPPAPATVRDIEERLKAARGVFQQIDRFVAPSRSIAEQFQSLGVDRSKIRVSDYGFVTFRRLPRNGTGGPLRIGYVGTLVWHKGVHALIDVVRGLPSHRYEVKIFGSLDVFPDYTAELRVKADGLPIRFMGAFDQAHAADVYRQMDVLVVPSLWLENSPLVIHEALMAGVPVVGARIGGITELVEHGRTGLLYDPESPGTLAAALGSLIDNPDRLRALSAGVLAAPPVKTIAEDAVEWEEVYAEVLQR